jgi:transmembrane sensor
MNEAEKLLEKYRAGTCSPREKMLVEKWFHHLNEDELTDLDPSHIEEAKDSFRQAVTPVIQRSRVRLWPRLVAAAILVIISAAIYMYKDSGEEAVVVKPIETNDLVPGGDRATLTLSDGRKISLTDAGNGELARQAGVTIIKTGGGQLLYKITGEEDLGKNLAFNKIETPVGGQFQVQLPDGSTVWLNSASSLRYPVRFGGSERQVEINGEAYFEVSRNPSKPFRVVSNRQTVEVLGTSFNIMAYNDEFSTNTTLIEGSVKVIGTAKSEIISPGEQTLVKGGDITVRNADIDEAMAWKNGYFIFKGENIGSIMRKISRWYDVKVDFQGVDQGKVFGGKISRSRKVSEVLKMLESTGSIHFKLVLDEPGKERRLIVMP